MRRVITILFSSFALLLAVFTCAAGDYATTDGQTLSGDPISFTADGVIIKNADGSLNPRVAYNKFSQEALKQLSANSKTALAASYIEPFLDEVIQQKKKRSEIVVEKVQTIPRPEGALGLSALFSSPLGLMFILVIYCANLHAGNEIGVYKNWPKKIALGASAILPFVAPIVLLCLPTRGLVKAEPELELEPVAEEPAPAPVNPALPDPGKPAEPPAEAAAPAPAGAPAEAPIYTPPPRRQETRAPINLPVSAANVAKQAAASAAAASAPAADVYSRKDFTFNKRFFETKMPGFFRVVLSEADQQRVIIIKSARGSFVGQRITKVTPMDLTLQIFKENATADEMIPFNEIQEVSIVARDSALE